MPYSRSRPAVRSAIILAACLLPATALAHPPVTHDSGYYEPHRAHWRPVLQTAISFGGEKLVEVEVEDFYGDDEEEDIKAGEAFLFGGGLLYDDGPFQLQATINYFVDGIFADNGDASFTRWPLEVMAFHATPRWRIGAGLTYHLNPEFELDIDHQADEKVDFDNALGAVAQIDYRATEQVNIGLRFTSIEYEPEHNSSAKIDGDNVGLVLSFSF